MKVAFYFAAGIVTYSAAFFPLFMVIRGALRKRAVHGSAFTPRISVVIAARNERSSIAGKIESVLACDYPQDLREVIVVSDGSTDDTESIVRSYARHGVTLISSPARGKAEALLAGVHASIGSILVFTDANGVLDRAALRTIVWPFGDPTVGGVAGDQRYRPTSDGIGAGEHRYWTFERLLKRAEGRSGDVVAATGGLYAIRRELFEPIPPGVNDDLFLSMGVVQRHHRLVFAPDAVAYESLASSSGAEVRRKIRIMTRGMRTVWARRSLLNPFRHGFYSIELFSHKVLRWLLVIPLLTLAVTGPLLWNEGWLFRLVSGPLIAAYGLGLLGILLSRTRVGRVPVLSLPAYFCAMNVSALAAVWNVIRGRSIEAWQPRRALHGPLLGPSPSHARGSNERGWRAGIVAVSILLGLALAAVSQPSIVAALVVVICVGAILAIRPDTSRLVAFGLLFSDASFVAVRFGGPLRLAALGVVIALGIPLLYDLVVRRERIELSPALPFLVAYVLVQALSALVATRAAASGQVLVVGGNAGSASVLRFMVEGLALYLVVSNVVRTREILRRSILVMLAVAAVLSALAFTNTLRGNYQNDYFGFVTAERIERGGRRRSVKTPIDKWETKYGGRRHAGPLRGRPNRWGVALVPLVPIGWVLAGQAKGRRKRILIGGVFLLTLGGLVFTFSRGTFLGLAAAVGVMVLFKSLRVRHVLAAVALGLAFIAVVPAVGGRLLSLRGISGVLFEDPDADPDASIRGRYTTSAAAILMFLDHPIAGVGPGNYPVWYREYANEFPVLVHPNDRRPHNLYLGTAAETGILGLLTLGAVCFVTLRELVPNSPARQRSGGQTAGDGVLRRRRGASRQHARPSTRRTSDTSGCTWLWRPQPLRILGQEAGERPVPALPDREGLVPARR